MMWTSPHAKLALPALIIFGLCHTSAGLLATAESSPISRVSPEEWRALNESVGGQLFVTLPVGLPCYDNFNGEPRSPDEAACANVVANKNNMTFLTTQIGGYTQGNWDICQSTGNGCPLSPANEIDPSRPCSQGNLPLYYVDATSVEDVQQTLRFATDRNVPIVVKNSGHDYKGRSAGAGSLALWVHNYTPAPTLEKSFIPEGCSQSVGEVVTFGTGEDSDGLYKFAYQNNVTIVGGSSPTVRPGGGWISGGGHSALSPVYGLGVDNVQQLRVVLPNGTYVTANHCQNQDIFFALRGGGGGTFGVIMDMSTLARPQLTIQWANITFFGLDEESQQQVLTVLVENANSWFESGWGGYIIPGATFPVWLMNPLLNAVAANASLQPLLDLATQLGATMQVTTYQSFYELYEEHIKNSEVARGGSGFAETSRLIPSKQFEGKVNQAALTKTLLGVISPTRPLRYRLMLLLTTPSRATQDSDSAVTPAWRSSTWHVIINTSWDSSKTSVDQVDAIFRNLTAAMYPLRYLTPGSGAYMNEGDTFEPDHISAFWGKENYERLQSIKQQVDPHKLMQVHQGVNYDASNPLFSCYPEIQKPVSQPEKVT